MIPVYLLFGKNDAVFSQLTIIPMVKMSPFFFANCDKHDNLPAHQIAYSLLQSIQRQFIHWKDGADDIEGLGI